MWLGFSKVDFLLVALSCATALALYGIFIM